MATSYYPMQPAGYQGYYQQPQQQQGYYPQPQQFSPPQQYGQSNPAYSMAYQQQQWQPMPPQAGGFHSHPPERGWNPQQTYNQTNNVPDYNNPPEPMYGKPNDGSQQGRDYYQPPQNVSRGETSVEQFGQSGEPGPNGERGLGATLVGGGGGAFIGHKLGGKDHGTLGTVGGALIGAIAANAFENHEKKKKEERRESRSYDEGYDNGERRGSRSRSIDDDERYSDYDDEEDYRPRHHHSHHHDYSRDDGYYAEQDGYDDYDYERRDSYYDRRDSYSRY